MTPEREKEIRERLPKGSESAWFSHFEIKDLFAEIDRLRVECGHWEAEKEKLKIERDLAIAHDRQPYPTAFGILQK